MTVPEPAPAGVPATCPECDTTHSAADCASSFPRFLLALFNDHIQGNRVAIVDLEKSLVAPFGFVSDMSVWGVRDIALDLIADPSHCPLYIWEAWSDFNARYNMLELFEA